jgi:hypothetical protein
MVADDRSRSEILQMKEREKRAGLVGFHVLTTVTVF